MNKQIKDLQVGERVVTLPHGCDPRAFRIGRKGEDPETRDWVRLYDLTGDFRAGVRPDEWAEVG